MESSNDEASRSAPPPSVVFIVGDNVGWGTSAAMADWHPPQRLTCPSDRLELPDAASSARRWPARPQWSVPPP